MSMWTLEILKIHICTHSPLVTLPMLLLFECRESPSWSRSFTLSWKCIHFECRKHTVFLWHQPDATLWPLPFYSQQVVPWSTHVIRSVQPSFPSHDMWQNRFSVSINQNSVAHAGGGWEVAYQLRTSFLGLGKEPSGKSWKISWSCLSLTTLVSLLF